LNRRKFIQAAAAGPALIIGSKPVSAAGYDLVIHGGRVIDPAQRIDRVLDLGIRGGKIATLSANIAASSANETVDASGRLVVPGLIDIHLHARDAELPPSAIMALGVTSMVDAGSRGADNEVDPIVWTKFGLSLDGGAG
jgi:predicted amidohydrolase